MEHRTDASRRDENRSRGIDRRCWDNAGTSRVATGRRRRSLPRAPGCDSDKLVQKVCPGSGPEGLSGAGGS